MNTDELLKKISKLEFENKNLKDELNAVAKSPYLPNTIADLYFKIILRREEILKHEIGAGINEKEGSLYDIKNQIKKYAPIIGLDPDSVRIAVTEAIQNIVEHGYGTFAEIELEINNKIHNPYLKMTFKHEMELGAKYTLSQIDENAKKGDITSEHFDFESSRGRGEFLMRELADERRVVNGVEIAPDGRKIHYFKRVLINYKDPKGTRAETSFDEIRTEIDRLDYEDVVCYFHIDHKQNKLNTITIVTHKNKEEKVRQIMEEAGFALSHKDTYYRTLFSSFVPTRDQTDKELEDLFAKVKRSVSAEYDVK
ncbi:MAG: ATP-binding protein [Leptospiraceae bacterium]|nr:ATP-binding protein [Leptospiraceae bacterium]MCK6380957.1 ATP-binding protein [Leptospiraceae bacterium]NUM40948.1 ATP-binding protein [Leptospiraceae bacterium]